MKKNSFVEGTLIATLAIIFTKILGMLYVIPFYSVIGSQGSSLYSYAYNIYLIFLSISSAGIPVAMSKLVSEYDSQDLKEAKVRSFKLGVLITSILSVVCFLVLIFFSEGIAKLIVGDVTGGNSLADITLVIFVVSFSVLIIPFLSIARGYLQGHKFIQVSSNSQMYEQIVRIIVILSGSFIAIKLLNLSVAVGVAIAVSGSFVGGLFAILYIIKKISRNKSELGFNKGLKKDNVSNKEILKKILIYALPFVIINLTVNIYNTVDMSLIIRTLAKIGFSGADAEYIAGVVTTWGYKLNMIVNSVATGLTVSLIPSIVSDYIKKDYKSVNNIFNKALQITLFCSVPAACGLSFLAKPVWNAFYGANYYGSSVFAVSILTAIFCNFYMVSIQTGQSLNKYKIVYIAVIGGFLTNALLDVPLMYLCNAIHIPAYYGASFATMIGYVFAIILVLHEIKKIEQINFKSTWLSLAKILLSAGVMLLILSILKLLLPFHEGSKLISILDIVIYTLVGGTVYITLMYKMGIITSLFGQEIIEKFLNIISFGLYKKKKRKKNDIKRN